jgi:hypothetical protein
MDCASDERCRKIRLGKAIAQRHDCRPATHAATPLDSTIEVYRMNKRVHPGLYAFGVHVRINSLETWRETAFHTGRERAALNWAEMLTRLTDHQSDHESGFALLKEHFTDQEIVELSWAIAQINAWNRMAVGMRQPPSNLPLA